MQRTGNGIVASALSLAASPLVWETFSLSIGTGIDGLGWEIDVPATVSVEDQPYVHNPSLCETVAAFSEYVPVQGVAIGIKMSRIQIRLRLLPTVEIHGNNVF
jgi:hypothetical protein